MIRKYHNHKPQITPWHREEEPIIHHETPGRQIKQSKQFNNYRLQLLEQLQTPTMGVTINKKSTTTEPPP